MDRDRNDVRPSAYQTATLLATARYLSQEAQRSLSRVVAP